jgi:hypothetical protein
MYSLQKSDKNTLTYIGISMSSNAYSPLEKL